MSAASLAAIIVNSQCQLVAAPPMQPELNYDIAIHHQSKNQFPTLVPDMADTEPEGAEEGDDSKSLSESDHDDPSLSQGSINSKRGPYLPPGIEGAHMAYEDLYRMLKPNQKTESTFDPITQERLEQVRQFI